MAVKVAVSRILYVSFHCPGSCADCVVYVVCRENVLLAKAGDGFVGKLADFGMTYSDDTALEVAAAETEPAASGFAQREQVQAADDDAVAPYGTWEYMSPGD